MNAETAALLFGLGRAQAATLTVYQLQEAGATLIRAFDYYAQAGDVAHAVAVAEYPHPACYRVRHWDGPTYQPCSSAGPVGFSRGGASSVQLR